MADMSEWVRALKDFGYDSNTLGYVRIGQVFQMQGCRNDSLLLKHRFMIRLDPQPKSEAGAYKGLSRCGGCGRYFLEEWQRDRCGTQHELTDEDRTEEAREAAKQRYKDTVQEDQAELAAPVQRARDS